MNSGTYVGHVHSAPTLLELSLGVSPRQQTTDLGPLHSAWHSAIKVYAMLPLDTVNSEAVFKAGSSRWFKQALNVLAASGVQGVAVDVWWGAVERSPGVYTWGGYKQLVELVKEAGLKMQAVLSFHACGGNVGDTAHIQLPAWVLQCGEQDPDLFFTDRPRGGLGQRNKEYLSIWSSDERLLCGRTAYECYADFMNAFREAFQEDLGTTIEEVVVGAGPCGELRYPSYPERHGWRFPGIGEFQCYDRRSLASLAAAAQAAGRPEWGYGGPHDAGHYNSTPEDTGFFSLSGSWDTAYGRFFLSWYSSCLLRHGERLLAMANKAFALRTPGPLPTTSATSTVTSTSQLQTVPSQPQQQLPTITLQSQQAAEPLPAQLVLLPPSQPPAAAAPARQPAASPPQQPQSVSHVDALQVASPVAQPPSSSTMSSHGSVQSSSNLCDSLHSNTPTSSCTAGLAHEPGMTSSSSSTCLCENSADAVGVVRGGEPGKESQGGTGPSSSSGGPAAAAWSGSPPGMIQLPGLGGMQHPSGIADVENSAAGLREELSGSQGTQSTWLGTAPSPSSCLPTPSVLTTPPVPIGGSNGGVFSPSYQMQHIGSTGGLVSPSAPATHSSMHAPPSMTLIASSSSAGPSHAASLCGSEATLHASLQNLGSSATAYGYAGQVKSPKPRFSDLSGLGMASHEQQMQFFSQLHGQAAVHSSDPAAQAPTRQLPRFMSCQALATEGNNPVGSAADLSRRQLGSGPSLSQLHQEPQEYTLTVATATDTMTLGLPQPQPHASATNHTQHRGPQPLSTTSTAVMQQPLPAGPTPPMAVAQGSTGPQAVSEPSSAGQCGVLVGQLSVSATSLSTQGSLVVEMEDAARNRSSLDSASTCSGNVDAHGRPVAAAGGPQPVASTSQRHPSHPAAAAEPPPRPASSASCRSLKKLPSHVVHGRLPVTLSLKIPGVHWWFRSRSHAAELTAGYYNTATRDGYAAVVELCARYGAALTLTCVEMCDAQHPTAACCSPEGLLKQIRSLTARHSVPLSGENALPIFLPQIVDTVALERIVINTRAWYGPRALTTAARQHAYLLALQQQQMAQLPPPMPPAGSQCGTQAPSDAGSQRGQQQQARGCMGMSSYPPYTGFTDSPTLPAWYSQQQGGNGYYVPGPDSASSLGLDSCLNRSFSDAGQMLCYQHIHASLTSLGSARQQYGTGGGMGSQPSSLDPTMHGASNLLNGEHSVSSIMGAAAAAVAGMLPTRAVELRSSPQIPDLSNAFEQGFAGVLGGGRAMSVGGNTGMSLDLPGDHRGVAACGLRTDSYVDIVEPLPAMRSFTFLRLGPELLLAAYQAPWLRFMAGMQQGGYAPC